MKIEDKVEYKIELDKLEIAALQDAAKIIGDIVSQMKNHNCSMVTSGYEDCPYDYQLEYLLGIKSILFRLSEAHTIRQ